MKKKRIRNCAQTLSYNLHWQCRVSDNAFCCLTLCSWLEITKMGKKHKEKVMEYFKDQYGNRLSMRRGDYIFDTYGNRIYEIRGNYIFDTYGSRVYEIRGNYIYDTYGSRKFEMRGDQLYDTYGNRLGSSF
ncbi:MAG: hypothetical protein LBB89_05645 [Treponema sp.]|nr:hypothetical protein [Treponema sp.]